MNNAMSCKTQKVLCREGRQSLACFIGTAVLVMLPLVSQRHLQILPKLHGVEIWSPLLYYALTNIIIRLLYRNKNYQIAIRASFLGFAEAVSIFLIMFASVEWKQFGFYAFFMAFFHYSEFLAIAWSNPGSLSTDSYILNHSWHYGLAAAASWLEFCLEVRFFPQLKRFCGVWIIGIVLCLFGEFIRKAAIFTANENFTHLVRYERTRNHKLVTHGIYAIMRHPSYFGWFWWSIGTQIILMNPLCLCLYAVISWKFFHDRIYIEEITLLNFFHSDYEDYQRKVPTGLPFIKGYLLNSGL